MIRWSFVASILLHAVVLLVIVPVACTFKGEADGDEKQGSRGGGWPEEHIKDKPMEVTIVEPPKPQTGASKTEYQKFQEKVATCEEWFSGIGVTLNGNAPAMVIQVHKYYPAHQAGIMPGDIIMTPIEKMRGGEVGSTVTVDLINGHNVRTKLKLTREKICLEDRPTPLR